ncbi:hypothetical protein AYI68_g3487, partial [Smittium mucronatum]
MSSVQSDSKPFLFFAASLAACGAACFSNSFEKKKGIPSRALVTAPLRTQKTRFVSQGSVPQPRPGILPNPQERGPDGPTEGTWMRLLLPDVPER